MPTRNEMTREPALSRVAFPGRTIVAASIVLVAVVGAFLLGKFTTSPRNDALVAATASIPATAHVERRSVVAQTVVQGSVSEGKTQRIRPAALPEAPVITRQLLQTGSEVTPGALLGSIADVPVFALPAPLPLYRDLVGGDEGDDVAALQSSLSRAGYAVEVTGRLDWDTMATVISIFSEAGYSLPTRPIAAPPADAVEEEATDDGAATEQEPSATETVEPVIPAAAFAAVENGRGTVISVAAPAHTVTDEEPFATVRVGDRMITARADVASVEQFSKGATVTITGAGATFTGTIERVGAFDAGGEGRSPGHDIVVSSTDPKLASLNTGTQVQVKPEITADQVTAVPVTAVRHDDEGDYVLVPPSETAQSPRRVSITVITSAGGWAAIEAPGLDIGDPVLI